MSTEEEKLAALVPVQSTALTKAGAKSLAVRGRHHLRDKEEAEEWLRKGLALQEAAPADPRVRRGGPLNPYAKRWLLRNDSFLFRGIEQEGETKQEQWRRRKDALKEALRCFESGYKVDPNNPELLYCLADSYYRENETEENEVKAVSLYQRAAVLGHTGAQLAIAAAYTQCGFRCLPIDERRALKWYRAAAEQGNEDGLSMFVHYYKPSTDADTNHAVAAKLIRKAAEQGSPHAQYLLGVLYDNSQGVLQDDAQAIFWIRKAAEQGNTDAQVSLGLAYKTGHGVAQDDAQAAIWLRKGGEEEVGNDQI